jgi:NAD(P)-dependent dehydrogenase (short-subunit alcohol dehydrogenase family)
MNQSLQATDKSTLPQRRMPVIAIVGAGPGIGLAIGKTFGSHGFNVALVSRSPRKLEPLVARLAKEGIDAAGFSANLFDRASIVSGLTAVTQRFGRIDVLEFSPASVLLPTASATELTHDNVQIHIDFYVHGAVAAVNQVLPDMLARRSGTIIITTGASSVDPRFGRPHLTNVALATAGLRHWAYALHAALAPGGVQVGHVAIGGRMWRGPGATPDAVAPLYWDLYTQRDLVEKVFMPETVSGQSTGAA